MSRKKRSFIFTDVDLDGAMSYLLFSWFGQKRFPYITVRAIDFRSSFEGWLKKYNTNNYDHIYILDIDVSQDCIDLVDRNNVVIIDHHSTHVRNKSKYKHAKVFIEEETSCSKLIYRLLHKKSKLTLQDKHKLLVLMVDDYDSYKLQLNNSHSLNLLFWNYQGDRVKKFSSDFKDGFVEFNSKQQGIIEFHQKKIKRVLSELELFTTTLPMGNNKYKAVSTFAVSHINDVADYIIKKEHADIGIVINLKSRKVSFRRGKGSSIDVSKVAKKLTGGGGHEYSAGGKITEKFLTLSKIFTPIKHED